MSKNGKPDSKKQIDLNDNVIDIGPKPEIPPKDALDEYIERFTPNVVDRYEKIKMNLLFSKDLVHMIVREFCLESSLFISNSTWSVRLIVSHITNKETLVPDKSEQFILPSLITDRRYNVMDFVRVGPSLDNIGGPQAGPAIVKRVEHFLYTDNSGVLFLAKAFIQNEAAYNEYCEAIKKTKSPTIEEYNAMVAASQKNNAGEQK